MFISSNPPLIPGIWTVAPTSTMVRLRLQRAETKSSCPTKKRDKRAAARDKTGTARDKTGTARDKIGTTRDKTGTARDKKGQGHNWTNAKHRYQVILKNALNIDS